MAEQEVIKHTKKVFGIWTTDNSFLHKLSEFLLEIFIIVFAITLSIYVHDQSELNHRRREAKEFLIGLREDLTMDLDEMKGDKESYTNSGAAFRYITGRKLHDTLSRDSMNKYGRWLSNTTGLIPNSGRFEGFKSSGKMSTIENRLLQNYIMDLYQENIPSLIISTNGYTSRKQRLFDYVANNAKRITDSTTNTAQVLMTDPAYNICNTLTFVNEILNRYDTCINKMHLIIAEIDKE